MLKLYLHVLHFVMDLLYNVLYDKLYNKSTANNTLMTYHDVEQLLYGRRWTSRMKRCLFLRCVRCVRCVASVACVALDAGKTQQTHASVTVNNMSSATDADSNRRAASAYETVNVGDG